jgi:DNA-binding transcriptional regulator YhcF (GntR family)
MSQVSCVAIQALSLSELEAHGKRAAQHLRLFEDIRKATFQNSGDLFEQSAWRLVIDLYLAGPALPSVSLSSLAAEAGLSLDVAKRYLRILERQQVVVIDSAQDNFSLAERAREQVTMALAKWAVMA